MKRAILTCTLALAILGGVRTVAADAADLTAGQRSRIETDLRSKLRTVVGVFDHLAFTLDPDGNVTLLGKVVRPITKKYAEEDAKEVDGVARIRNRIEVLPLSPADDELRLRLYTSIYSQSGLNRYALQAVPPIHIIVDNGDVTLEGVVATQLEHAQANAAANAVPGVFSVENNLRIEQAS